MQSLRCLINAHHLSYSSFQDLWKILIGHSSFRDPVSTVPQLYAFESHIFLFVKALIKAEVEPCAAQLLNGLDSYKKPNTSALKKLEASKAVKGPSKNFVIGLSKYLVCMYMYMYNLMSLIASININYQFFFPLIPPGPLPTHTYTQDLDEEQSLELFESFLSSSYRGSLSELNKKLVSERERLTILQQIRDYYHSERLHLLRCLKQLLGYWQDPEHDYRVTYRNNSIATKLSC